MSKSLSLLVKHWKSLFASDKFAELFLELGQHLNSGSEASNQFLHLQQRYNKARKNENEGTVSRENAVLENNQINKALIAAIDALQVSDLDKGDVVLDPPKHIAHQQMSADKKTIQIFIAYSQKDRTELDALRTHAKPLLRKGNVTIWFDGEIKPGKVWDEEIKANLHAADIILMLLSSNSLASDYFYEQEVKDALKRHEAGTARVVPVVLSACLWQETPLAALQGLPKGMKPINSWLNREDAWHEVLLGLIGIVREIEKGNPPEDTNPAVPARKSNAAEEHAWEFTADADTRVAYEKFLTRFPDGYYAATAREHLHDFEADDTAWEFATDSGSEKAIQKYLDKYPEGGHASEAQQKVAAFERERNEAVRKKKEQETADRLWVDPFYDLMVPIKGGTFEMGDTFGDGNKNEKPVHSVTLSDFSLCKYLVTQGLWKAVMGHKNPSYLKGDDLRPVESVSWEDVQEFIVALNKKSVHQYRLPTEAEWEYASRGGRASKGYKYSGSNDINEVAWYKENSGYEIHQVGSLKPNELGLFDMSGNLWEWCIDWYDATYYEICQKEGIVVNPTGPDKGFNRVVRGGNCYSRPQECYVAYRDSNESDVHSGVLGFRLALQRGG